MTNQSPDISICEMLEMCVIGCMNGGVKAKWAYAHSFEILGRFFANNRKFPRSDRQEYIVTTGYGQGSLFAEPIYRLNNPCGPWLPC